MKSIYLTYKLGLCLPW